MNIWIAYLPIRMWLTYPDAANLSGCLEPVRVERSLSPAEWIHDVFQCRPVAISHAIPRRVFHDLNYGRWNHAVLGHT